MLKLPKTGHELLTCFFPLQLDCYVGCLHKCIYCYAENYKKKVRKIKIGNLKEIIKSYKGKDTPIGMAVKKKIPIRLGARTDCFHEMERKEKITKRVIEELNEIDYPYIIITKSSLVMDYIDILDEKLAVIQFSISTLNDEVAKKIEPYAPPPSERIKAMEELSNAGFFAIARFSPVIPNINLNEAEKIMERIDFARHIIVEFLRAREGLVKALKLRDYVRKGFYYRYDLHRKLKAYEKLKEIANQHGLKFTICSDGDRVPYYLNDTINCCGIKFNGVERVAAMVYEEARKRKEITLKHMEKYWHPMPHKFIKEWLNGRFEELIYGLKWNEEKQSYELE